MSRSRRNFTVHDHFDPDIAEALASLGVFASHYPSNTNISSDLWNAQGFSQQEMGRSLAWIERIHPDDRNRVARAAERIFAGRSTQMEEIFRMRRRNGTYRWVVTRGRTVRADDDGAPILYIGVDTDISRFKAVEHRLQRQNDELETLRQVAAVVGSSLDMEETVRRILEQTQRIIPYDTATVQLLEDNQLRIIGGFGFDDISAVMKLRFPYPEEGSLSTEAIDSEQPIMSLDVTQDFPAFVQPEQSATIYSWIGIPLIRHGEVIGLFTADATRRDAYDESHLRLAATIADHIAIALENARLHDRTYRMAMSDALTGTGTRHRFQVEGRLLYESAVRNERPLGVMMLDIDHFKAVNDTVGHRVGDRILQRVASVCQRQLRGSDLIARYGGEEFVMLLPEASEADARAAAGRMREEIAGIEHPELPHPVTASIGIAALNPGDTSSFDTLIQTADHALYRAKHAGRNAVRVAPLENAGS